MSHSFSILKLKLTCHLLMVVILECHLSALRKLMSAQDCDSDNVSILICLPKSDWEMLRVTAQAQICISMHILASSEGNGCTCSCGAGTDRRLNQRFFTNRCCTCHNASVPLVILKLECRTSKHRQGIKDVVVITIKSKLPHW